MVVYLYKDHIKGSEPKYILVKKESILRTLMNINKDKLIDRLIPNDICDNNERE